MITAAEIEANLAATIAEFNRKREAWFAEFPALYERLYRESFDTFPANYERMMKASSEEFVAKYEHFLADFWASWTPPGRPAGR
jgi:hypothetical protein